MKLVAISSSTLRAMLRVMRRLDVFPAQATAIATELGRREVDRRESSVTRAMQRAADLRAEGFSAWLGVGGDA